MYVKGHVEEGEGGGRKEEEEEEAVFRRRRLSLRVNQSQIAHVRSKARAAYMTRQHSSKAFIYLLSARKGFTFVDLLSARPYCCGCERL